MAEGIAGFPYFNVETIEIPDPGDEGVIDPEFSAHCIVNIAGADEVMTVGYPVFVGQIFIISTVPFVPTGASRVVTLGGSGVSFFEATTDQWYFLMGIRIAGVLDWMVIASHAS